MSTAVMGTPYSPPSPPATSSSATMSPTMSPIYPDRPIRPLPKRSLKDRLSLEAADSINYPSVPTATNATFYVPYSDPIAQRATMVTGSIQDIDKGLYRNREPVIEDDKGTYRFRGNELTSEDEDDVGVIRRYQDYQQRQSNGMANGHPQDAENTHSIASSNDSADGYDSFENTNNKKKRKIPTSGHISASMSVSLSQDMAKMGISNDPDRADNGISHYYDTRPVGMASGTGISGAGRGRYGRGVKRDPSNRLPLHSSINGSNAWSNGKASIEKRESIKETSVNDKGIISQAIADAAALSHVSSQGQENVSLLEQQSQRKSPSAKSQFTFTYESDSSNKPIWPGDNKIRVSQYNPHMPAPLNPHSAVNDQARRDFSTHATQTSPPMESQNGQEPPGAYPAEAPRKPRRSAAKRYAMAARERRAQQEYNNYHHPPKEEDFWICEFCEYESIFGRPPEALIKQYEMKDEKERKRLAEKRRLLEKAKMKGRKGKKGNKHAKGVNNANASLPAQPPYDPAMPANHPPYGHPDDEYYDDGYVDEPGPTPAPSPEPLSKIPQPTSQASGQNRRSIQGAKQVHNG